MDLLLLAGFLLSFYQDPWSLSLFLKFPILNIPIPDLLFSVPTFSRCCLCSNLNKCISKFISQINVRKKRFAWFLSATTGEIEENHRDTKIVLRQAFCTFWMSLKCNNFSLYLHSSTTIELWKSSSKAWLLPEIAMGLIAQHLPSSPVETSLSGLQMVFFPLSRELWEQKVLIFSFHASFWVPLMSGKGFDLSLLWLEDDTDEEVVLFVPLATSSSQVNSPSLGEILLSKAFVFLQYLCKVEKATEIAAL